MAESELSVVSSQCLNRRIPDKDALTGEIAAWQAERNRKHTKADWQFTTADARIKQKGFTRRFERLGVLAVRITFPVRACAIEAIGRMWQFFNSPNNLTSRRRELQQNVLTTRAAVREYLHWNDRGVRFVTWRATQGPYTMWGVVSSALGIRRFKHRLLFQCALSTN
jgi:hypothetical protein